MAGRLVVWLGSWVRGIRDRQTGIKTLAGVRGGRIQGLPLNRVVCHLNPLAVLGSLGAPSFSKADGPLPPVSVPATPLPKKSQPVCSVICFIL